LSNTKKDSCEHQTRAFFGGLSVFFGLITGLMYASSRIAMKHSQRTDTY
jgi:hypothetical protein